MVPSAFLHRKNPVHFRVVANCRAFCRLPGRWSWNPANSPVGGKLVVEIPLICRVSYILGGCLGFQTINGMFSCLSLLWYGHLRKHTYIVSHEYYYAFETQQRVTSNIFVLCFISPHLAIRFLGSKSCHFGRWNCGHDKPGPKRKNNLQPSIFRGKLLVAEREKIEHLGHLSEISKENKRCDLLENSKTKNCPKKNKVPTSTLLLCGCQFL